MKTAVLSFHQCINYGSYWQAYHLVHGLRHSCVNAVLMQYQDSRINRAEWRCALSPTLPVPTSAPCQEQYKQKIRAFFSAFELLPCTAPFPLQSPEKSESYDCIIIGSDEVWNLHHPWYNNIPIFFGEGLRASTILSYAASFGNYSAWYGLPGIWAERLKKLQHISVRDENAKYLVLHALGEAPPIVLDPCLQFNLHLPAVELRIHRPYIAVYGHNFSSAFIRKIKAYARHTNLPLVSIGYQNDWADQQWINAGPLDFAPFMQHAAAIATNFFHGCVFALKYQRPFAAETTAYRNIKIDGLLRLTQSLHHLLQGNTSAEQVTKLLSNPIAETVLQRIAALRHTGSTYLAAALPSLQQIRA